MEPVWFKPELSDEITRNEDIFKQSQSIIADLICHRLEITRLVENMSGVLTCKEVENRVKGMRFFTKILTELPDAYLNESQVKFISSFYIDRLKDNYRVIPCVLEGYLSIINMKNYNIQWCVEFFVALFREVSCQSQVREDRYRFYMITKKLMDKDLQRIKALGPDFIFGLITAIDGERDPRNLLFLFSFLPKFISDVSNGQFAQEMFEVLSCYFPVDFNPSPDDPVAVSRQELATALMPCLCAIPQFAEPCLLLLVEKLDSSLKIAKIDSLKLLTASCKTFNTDSYGPFLKALWSTIHREILNKNDDELVMAAHEALSALVTRLSHTANTDQGFENFVKGIIISMQTDMAEATMLSQFIQISKVFLTTANASKDSCIIITKIMIPAAIVFYSHKTNSPKLQIASLEFLGQLYDLAKHWKVLNEVESQVNEIPQLALAAVSEPAKEFQIAGFKTLIRVKDILQSELVLPFVEVLIYNVQFSNDNDLLSVSIETVHALAGKFPELIMNLVVKGKCDLDNLTQDKVALQKRLNLLSNLASIDDFTKVILEQMLKLISSNDDEAVKVVEALRGTMSNSNLYSVEKVTQIESDHGLIESILTWINNEIEKRPIHNLEHGFSLISNTIASLPVEKQVKILSKHTKRALLKSATNEMYFFIVESLYNSIDQKVDNENLREVMSLSLHLSLDSENEVIRSKACILIAHFLNKAEYGVQFELLYELLKKHLSSRNRDNVNICPRLIVLYGWITKALIMRGSDCFSFWLQKIMVAISSPDFCRDGAEAIKLIVADFQDYFTVKHHCRISLFYKQRIFQTFSEMAGKLSPVPEKTKESYLLCWAYMLEKAPRTVLNNEVEKITPLVIDSLSYDNKDLLVVMIDVLSHFVKAVNMTVALSLQTILPRLVNLTKYVKSMDVRIKSLQCLYEIAHSYRTMLLLPYKQDILIDLAQPLDDKKRLVRNMAVKARTRWYLVGAPGENKDN